MGCGCFAIPRSSPCCPPHPQAKRVRDEGPQMTLIGRPGDIPNLGEIYSLRYRPPEWQLTCFSFFEIRVFESEGFAGVRLVVFEFGA